MSHVTKSQAASHDSWLVRYSLTFWDLSEAISIARSKISYILIEPQPLLCTPTCGCEFHSLVVHPHPTFAAPAVRSGYGIRLEFVVELFCGNSLHVRAVGYFHRGAPSLMFDKVLNVTPSEEVSTTGVTQGNLKLLLHPNSSDSHQTQIQEDEILDWCHVRISLKENSSTS